MNELSLFSGAGGGILAGQMLGWRTVCAVEIDPYAAGVLVARQNDGSLPPFPVWDDVCTFDGRPWRGIVDVVSGGFPCQDISVAGSGAGIEGERSGLWTEYARIIREVRPRFAFVENSPALTSRGLGIVLGDLAALGYDAEWSVLGASDVGAPHIRKRIWFIAWDAANADRDQRETGSEQHGGRQQRGTAPAADGGCDVADAESMRWREECQDTGWRAQGGRTKGRPTGLGDSSQTMAHANSQRREELDPAAKPDHPRRNTGRTPEIWDPAWWATEPGMGRVVDGMANRLDRIRGLGNGQVPLCAAEAWRQLYRRMTA